MASSLNYCGVVSQFAMAPMSAVGFLTLLLLISAVAALFRYIVHTSRHGWQFAGVAFNDRSSKVTERNLFIYFAQQTQQPCPGFRSESMRL